jgi:hypothetical protein
MQLTKEIIIEVTKRRNINPYKKPFRPRDLGLNAGDYGAFSDYCEETQSSQWNRSVILNPVEFDRSGRPKKYLLLK